VTELGKFMTPMVGGLPPRDAVHVATLPCIAGEALVPGQMVGFVAGKGRTVGTGVSHPMGVIDPFIERTVHPGEIVHVLMKPGTIKGLRHDWSHEVVDDLSFDDLDPDDPVDAVLIKMRTNGAGEIQPESNPLAIEDDEEDGCGVC